MSLLDLFRNKIEGYCPNCQEETIWRKRRINFNGLYMTTMFRCELCGLYSNRVQKEKETNRKGGYD